MLGSIASQQLIQIAHAKQSSPILIIVDWQGPILTALCEGSSGKSLDQKSFKKFDEYKRYRKKLEEASDVTILKIKEPWEKPWDKRYNLASWQDASKQVHAAVPELLTRFASLCDDDYHRPRAQAPLLLLGTFLSGYTSEPFYDLDRKANGSSKARAVILNVPWAEGVSDFLREVTDSLSCDLFQHMEKKTYLKWKPHKIISKADGKKPFAENAQPVWGKPQDPGDLIPMDPFDVETVTGKVKIPMRRVNSAVLIEQWTGLPVKKTEEFIRSNPFCAAVVLRSSRTKIEVESQLPLNAKELVWVDKAFDGWQDMQNLMHGFISAVFNDTRGNMHESLVCSWKTAENLIARYQAQKGVSRLTAGQRRTWRMLVASLLAFLDYLRFCAHKLTNEEYSALREDWLWRLLPGCIAGETVNRPALAKRPVVVEQDYLEVFLALIDRIRSADGGIHILRVSKDERLFELTDPDNPGIEIYGYYADIYLRSAGRPFYCLVFRKQTLLNLMRSFMPEVVSMPLDAGRVLRYALKTKWAQDNVLRQADGYFKLHMPVDLQDKTTTYAVAIKIDREKRNELKDVIGVWEGSTNPDGTQSWKLSHTTAD